MTNFKQHAPLLSTLKISLKRTSLAILMAASLSSPTLLAQDLYEEGQRQLDNNDYSAAQEAFASAAQVDDARQDAALYWLAYAQFKNRRDQEALRSIDQLVREHPKSRWLDEAKALKVEIQDKRGESVNIDDDEMKLYALNSLMNSPPEKSVLILQKLLAGNSSDQLKHRALFILSQINDPKAFETVATLAKDNSNPDLQEQAIQVLGISGPEQAMELLEQIYQSTDNESVKARVLHSYMIANQNDKLMALARTETNPELKRQAIHLISTMSDSDVLLEMYRDASFKEFREDLIQGMAIDDGVDALLEVINAEQDETYVAQAVQKMGIIDASKTGTHLMDIYQERSSHSVRDAVIQAMFMQSNTEGLLKIVKTETSAELKRSALQKLSLMGSDEALDYFDSILNED